MTESGWRYVLARPAIRDLERLEPNVRRRVFEALDRLTADPASAPRRKLRGSPDEWRLRVGDWRVRYQPDFEERVIVVTRVRHRREVYREQ